MEHKHAWNLMLTLDAHPVTGLKSLTCSSWKPVLQMWVLLIGSYHFALELTSISWGWVTVGVIYRLEKILICEWSCHKERAIIGSVLVEWTVITSASKAWCYATVLKSWVPFSCKLILQWEGTWDFRTVTCHAFEANAHSINTDSMVALIAALSTYQYFNLAYRSSLLWLGPKT